MKIFLDSADLEEIRAARALGFLDGVTMNPKLLARAARPLRELVPELSELVPGPLCLPAQGETLEELLEVGRQLARLHARVVVKIPLGVEGLRAMQRLQAEGIGTHATLCGSASQALLAAKCGAIFVSPFVGRLEEQGEASGALVGQILEIYGRHGYATQVMVASVRHRGHVEEAAWRGAQACTMPWNVLRSLAEHPLTDLLKLDYKPEARREG